MLSEPRRGRPTFDGDVLLSHAITGTWRAIRELIRRSFVRADRAEAASLRYALSATASPRRPSANRLEDADATSLSCSASPRYNSEAASACPRRCFVRRCAVKFGQLRCHFRPTDCDVPAAEQPSLRPSVCSRPVQLRKCFKAAKATVLASGSPRLALLLPQAHLDLPLPSLLPPLSPRFGPD